MKRGPVFIMALILLLSIGVGFGARFLRPGGEKGLEQGEQKGEESQDMNEEEKPPPPQILTGKVTGLELTTNLRVEQGPKSVELAPDGHHIFVNDLYAHKNFVFDIDTYQQTMTIALPDEPVEMDFSPDGKWAWVSLYNSSRVLLIDLQAGSIVAAVPTGTIPKEVQVSPDGKWVYVANWQSNSVTIIDAAKRARIKDISLYGTPRGICFSPSGDKAYVCIMGGNTLVVFDVASGHQVVGQIPCGQNPRHVVCTGDGRYLYVSNNAPGTVTKIDRSNGTIVAVAKVGKMARTIALAPDENYLFVCNYDDNTVGCVETASMKQIFTVPCSKPIGMTVSPNGDRLFVSNYSPPQISVFRIKRD